MKLTKESILIRLRNWKVWIATASLAGFLFTQFGMHDAKTFLDDLMPYVFTLGMSLGVWSSHGQESEANQTKEERE